MMRERLAQWLRLVRQPSLIRRLLLAQMLCLAALWALATTLMLHDAQDNDDLLRMDSIFALAASITHHQASTPDSRQQTLHAFTKALQESYGEGVVVPQLFVWQGEELIYHSAAPPPDLRPAHTDQVVHIQSGGEILRTRTVAFASGSLRITLVLPGLPTTLLSFHSHGFYLMPLFVSLPFLALPAFVSLRVALRPWQGVADEITARQPGDLRALSASPPHRELRPLIDSVNALLAQVRVSLQRERNLTADAAHELRTPLAALHVNAEALAAQTTSPADRELLDNLLRCNERAARVVSQLLHLMRSEVEPVQALNRTLCLHALAQDRLAVLDALAQARRIEVELIADGEPPFELEGNEEALTSLIDNLVENAIKYSPVGGAVSVRVARSGECLELQVSDNGPGIAQALRERVFDRFYRLPTASQSGSGLGLTIARAAVQRHAGSISLATGCSGGLRVIVRLPGATQARQHPAPGA